MEINTTKQEEFAQQLNETINERKLKKSTIESDIRKMQNLKGFIQKIIDTKMKEINSKIDIGAGIYYDVLINHQNKIILNIGCDVYLEVELQKAIEILSKKEEVLNKKLFIIDEELIKDISYYKLTQDLIKQLKANEIY